MAASSPKEVLDVDGPAAPPRRNGELVFAAPWESRVFGVTISLHRAGVFEWDEFRQLLIQEIAAWEKQGHSEEEWSYYERWQAALERLLGAKGLCSVDDLEQRVDQLEQRPPDHDH